ncbi:MAG: hypothetical protein KDB27_02565 [Planctomycetales bacterium]|nr:hypothetical protein [Planctomycetales bacterium]
MELIDIDSIRRMLADKLDDLAYVISRMSDQLVSSLFSAIGDFFVYVFHTPHLMGMTLAIIGAIVMSKNERRN